MLSDAVGSSSSSSSGWPAIARAMAISCRWPPDSDLMLRVVSVSGMPSLSSTAEASVWILTSDSRCLRRSRPSSRFEAISRLSHSDRSCQTTPTPCLAAVTGSAGQRPAAQQNLAAARRDVAGQASDERGLARTVLAGQRDDLAGPDLQVDAVERAHRAETDGQAETLTTAGTSDLACPSGARASCRRRGQRSVRERSHTHIVL